jgi:hypothetical protein
MQINELFSAVMTWAAFTGSKNIQELPGCWQGETKKLGDLGPFKVQINGHDEQIDHIPAFHASIEMPGYFPGLIAIVGPRGAVIVGSRTKGEDEAGLIDYFKAQVRFSEKWD